MCRLQIFCVTCLIFPGRLSFEFWSQHKILLYLGWRYSKPCIKNMAMRQVPCSSLPCSWYDSISLICPQYPPCALNADINRKKRDFSWILSIGYLAYLFSTSLLRMFPYRASLYLHSQLISYTSAKHYGDEKCSYILQDLTADASRHWWVEKPDDGKTKTLTICNRVDRRINIHLVCFRCFNAWWFNLDTFRSLSGDPGMCCTYFNRL